MAMRSVLGLLYLLQGLKAAGEDTQALMQRLSLDTSLLDPASMIDVSLEYALQQQIMQSVRRPGVGLHIGQQYNLAGYGSLLMLLMTSPSLMEALRAGVHYQRLTFLFGRVGIKPQGDLMLLTYESLEQDPHMHYFRAECEIAGTFKLLKDLQAALGLKISMLRVDLPYSAPKDSKVLDEYHAYYGTDLRFDQSIGAIYSRMRDLDYAFPAADAVTHQRYRQQCDELLKQFEQDAWQSSIKQQIKDYLLLQSGQIPSMSLVAQVLNLSERALRYRLTAENTSFRQIRDEVLYVKAQQLLQQHLSIEEVAEQLCYSETAAFIHAFKRWSGQTPYQFKKGG